MRLIFVITDLLLPPATGEGGDGGDSNVDAPFAKTPPSRPSPTQRGKEILSPAIAAFSIKAQTECNTALVINFYCRRTKAAVV